MLLSFPGLTKAMDIEKLEAMVFESFAAGVSVEIRPRKDVEYQIRSRLKGKLLSYDQQRASGEFNGKLLQEILYQVALYWKVAPKYRRKPVHDYSDLCAYVVSLPGVPPCLSGDHPGSGVCNAA